MRIIYDNLIDNLAASSISVSTEITNFPAINIQDERLSKQWRTDANTTQQATLIFPTFPQFPDNATATTYLQDAWATTDGWTAIGATLTASATGILKAVATATAYTITKTITIPDNSTFRTRIRITSGTLDNYKLFIHDAIGYAFSSIIPFSALNTWTLFDTTFSRGVASDSFGIDNGAGNVGATFEIDTMYVGTGLYDTNLVDNSENAYNATVYGPMKVEQSSYNGLLFDGVNDYIETNSTINLVNLGFTTSFMMHITSYIAGVQMIVFNASGGGSLPYVAINNGYILFSFNDANSVQRTVTSTGQVPLNAWAFVCATHDGTNATIYINTATTSNTYSLNDPFTAKYRIGGNFGGIDYFKGILDKVKIWMRGLNSSEVTSLYNNLPFSTEKMDLVADWELDKNYKINVLSILGHNIKSNTKVVIEANHNNEWHSPSLSQRIPYIYSGKSIFYFIANNYTYKYWKITFSGQGSLQIGRIWLGKYLAINPSSLLDFVITKKNSDTIIYGRGRQKFSSPGITWRAFKLSFPETQYDMIYQIENMLNNIGNNKSVIFCNFDTDRSYEIVEPCYCSMVNNETSFDHTELMKFTYELSLEENK